MTKSLKYVFLVTFLLAASFSCKHDASDLLFDKKPEPGGSTGGGPGSSGLVVIAELGGNTTATEGGAGDTYTIVLASQPTANVTITLSPDAQVTATAASPPLTFTAGTCPGTGNWCTPQTVNVGAVNDALLEGNHTGIITHTAASTDSAYNGTTIANVTVIVIDNDSAGVSIVQSGSTTASEAGASGSYTVVLTTQPGTDVTITLSPDAQTTAMPTSLIFAATCPAANCWNIAQTVTVGAVNDAIAEGAHNGTITHTAASTDVNYSGIAIGNVTVNITDNDTAGVTIAETSGTTASEGGGGDIYTVVLTSEPTAPVTITLNPGTQTTVTPSPSLTFTSSCPSSTCWSTAQTVTVGAVNDSVAEGAHNGTITHTATSSDTNYSGIPIGNVTVNITDNDTAGVTIAENSGTTVSESGGSDSYTVVLTSEPTAPVTITLNPGTQTTVTPSPSLTFTSSCPSSTCWSTTQTVTVGAVNDFVAEGAHTGTITHTPASTDGVYNSVTISNVTVNITDNDTAGVTITESSGTTATEGGAGDTYTVVLNTQPTADVTITLTPDTQVTATVTPSPLLFTAGVCPGPGNWCTARIVTVAAVIDVTTEGAHTGTITHAAASSDSNYGAITIASVTVNITDGVAPIYIYSSTSTTTGAMGGRTGADNTCSTSKPPSLTSVCSTVHAYISIADSAPDYNISQMPAAYGISTTAPIRSVNGTLFQNNWAALYTSGPLVSALAAGIFLTAESWWSFSDAATGVTNTSGRHCTGGTLTTGGGGNKGASGDATQTGALFFVNSPPLNCSDSAYLLCVCY